MGGDAEYIISQKRNSHYVDSESQGIARGRNGTLLETYCMAPGLESTRLWRGDTRDDNEYLCGTDDITT